MFIKTHYLTFLYESIGQSVSCIMTMVLALSAFGIFSLFFPITFI